MSYNQTLKSWETDVPYYPDPRFPYFQGGGDHQWQWGQHLHSDRREHIKEALFPECLDHGGDFTHHPGPQYSLFMQIVSMTLQWTAGVGTSISARMMAACTGSTCSEHKTKERTLMMGRMKISGITSSMGMTNLMMGWVDLPIERELPPLMMGKINP